MNDEELRLLEKLRKIEALHAGASTPGERAAAANARDRIREKLKATELLDPPLEFTFTTTSPYSRRVLIAMLRRYGIEPYRRRGQRHTTLMAKVSTRFVDDTLWPEYLAVVQALEVHLSAVTDRIIAEAIHADTSEAAEADPPAHTAAGDPKRLG